MTMNLVPHLQLVSFAPATPFALKNDASITLKERNSREVRYVVGYAILKLIV